jgi:hypothetical protein
MPDSPPSFLCASSLRGVCFRVLPHAGFRQFAARCSQLRPAVARHRREFHPPNSPRFANLSEDFGAQRCISRTALARIIGSALRQANPKHTDQMDCSYNTSSRTVSGNRVHFRTTLIQDNRICPHCVFVRPSLFLCVPGLRTAVSSLHKVEIAGSLHAARSDQQRHERCHEIGR